MTRNAIAVHQPASLAGTTAAAVRCTVKPENTAYPWGTIVRIEGRR